jgi:hypothetical protein
MKTQGTMTLQKVSIHTTKDLMDDEEDEISIFESKRMMRRMTNEVKEGIYQHLNKIKKNMNKQLNEFKEIQMNN